MTPTPRNTLAAVIATLTVAGALFALIHTGVLFKPATFYPQEIIALDDNNAVLLTHTFHTDTDTDTPNPNSSQHTTSSPKDLSLHSVQLSPNHDVSSTWSTHLLDHQRSFTPTYIAHHADTLLVAAREPNRTHLHAFNNSTGQPLFTHTLNASIHPTNTYTLPTHDSTAYLFTQPLSKTRPSPKTPKTSKIYALSLSSPTPPTQPLAVPDLSDFISNHTLFTPSAIHNPHRSNVTYSLATSTPIYFTPFDLVPIQYPCITHDSLWTLNTQGHLTKLDLTTHTRTTLPNPSLSPDTTPETLSTCGTYKDLFIFSTLFNNQPGSLFAINRHSGALVWTFRPSDHTPNPQRPDRYNASPFHGTLNDSIIFTTSSYRPLPFNARTPNPHNGSLFWIDSTTGTLRHTAQHKALHRANILRKHTHHLLHIRDTIATLHPTKPHIQHALQVHNYTPQLYHITPSSLWLTPNTHVSTSTSNFTTRDPLPVARLNLLDHSLHGATNLTMWPLRDKTQHLRTLLQLPPKP